MIQLTKDEAAAYMLGHHQLTGFHHEGDRAGLLGLLRRLRCIQLDPLAPLGSSPDLVVQARVQDYRMGDVFSLLMPGYAFEHYAKERCLLPAEAFPYYQAYVAECGIWPRMQRWMNHLLGKVTPEILEAVLERVGKEGPISPSQLGDHGDAVPMDWSGWKGTDKAAKMAVEILWARCQVAVCGRNGREKIYDTPQRALGEQPKQAADAFYRWALLQRVEAAGLLPRNSGPHWSMLNNVRKDLPERLIEEGLLCEVNIEAMRGKFLAPVDFQKRSYPACDDHMRILGPLDAFLWYRPLIEHVFSFEYVWEVYKPEKQRRWGWYVCPLLHQGKLVGRLQGKAEGDTLVINTVWRERDHQPDRDALKLAMKRHIRAMGLKHFKLPRRFRISK